MVGSLGAATFCEQRLSQPPGHILLHAGRVYTAHGSAEIALSHRLTRQSMRRRAAGNTDGARVGPRDATEPFVRAL